MEPSEECGEAPAGRGEELQGDKTRTGDGISERPTYPYRVFICYAHEDIALVRKLAEALKRIGLCPWWSEYITPGMPFPEAIKTMIAHCHIFMPLLTETSSKRGWVHQEIGYALALDVPVLPVAVGKMPEEMLAQLHAVEIEAGWTAARISEELQRIDLRGLVMRPPPVPPRVVEAIDFHEERTRLLAEYSRYVLQVSGHVFIRQLARMSSLSIPDLDVAAEEWDKRDGGSSPLFYHYRWLRRQERQILEEHIRRAGGRFIISPETVRGTLDPEAFASRVRSLLDTLTRFQKDGVRLEIVAVRGMRERNLTIVGDWFVAEAFFAAGSGGYRKTVFHWHGPTVLRWIEWFDREFAYLCERAQDRATDVVGPGLDEVIQYLRRLLHDGETGEQRVSDNEE